MSLVTICWLNILVCVCACVCTPYASVLSINDTQVAMVSLLVSASVCVSWYHSLVSVSVRPTQFDPDPVSLLFPTPLSCVCIVSPNPQIPWYVGGISTIFPGHCCLCLARCACKFPHREGDKHTHTVTHIYKPHHIAAHTLYGEEFTTIFRLAVRHWLFDLHFDCLWGRFTEYSAFWPNSESVIVIRTDKCALGQVTQGIYMRKIHCGCIRLYMSEVGAYMEVQ